MKNGTLGKIAKVSVTDGPKSPDNYFNKVSRLWTSQTYLENMFSVFKSEEILFEANVICICITLV